MLQEGKIKLYAVQEGSKFHTDLDLDYMYDGDGEAQRIVFSCGPILCYLIGRRETSNYA